LAVMRHLLRMLDTDRAWHEALQAIRGKDDSQARLFWLSYVLNRYLKELVKPTVAWESGRFIVRFAPQSLLGAMWLKFALDISRTAEVRKCEFDPCGNWFEISSEAGTRRTKRFCSDACKIKQDRVRQAEASYLRDSGLAPFRIAKRMGVPVRTVHRWLVK